MSSTKPPFEFDFAGMMLLVIFGLIFINSIIGRVLCLLAR